MADDERQARQLLLVMQEKLSRDPHDALGLTNTTPADVRAAFLALTKVYHPARFARMSSELQRLSNEVFLALRAAHDQMMRPQVKPPAAKATGTIPVFRPPPTSSGRPPSGVLPAARPASPTATSRTATGPLPGPAARSPATAARSTTPPAGMPVTGRPSATPGRNLTPTAGTPTTGRPGAPTAQGTQAMRPMGGPAAADASRPTRMPTSSPAPSTMASPTAPGGRAPAPAPAGARPAAPADPEIAGILELLAQDRLSDARIELAALVARRPNIPRYQALIHYAKGREAQLARRIDEARVELMDALQLDPDLQPAKTALGELFTRRK